MGEELDLSRYSKSDVIEPGNYVMTIALNDNEQLKQHVVVQDGDKTQEACFPVSEVVRWGILLDRLPSPSSARQLLTTDCIDVEDLIPGARLMLDAGHLRGSLSIPQAYMGHTRRNYIAPGDWDAGITAGILSYHANVFHSEGQQSDTRTDAHLTLNTGLNINGWRLRHNGNLHSDDTTTSYHALNSYAQKDIDSFRSQLSVGEYFTPGNNFDSIPFLGAQLANDDSMLPESERGYAPVIRGTAQSHARVTVRQNSHVIYETSVEPGPFIIDDLYATGYAGDLNVIVAEADGSLHGFTVPFSSVIQMLRPGASRFNLAAGTYRDDSLPDAPDFAQLTYRQGISNRLTLYGGVILSGDYQSTLTGAAVGTSMGALALDTTLSRADDLPMKSEMDHSSSASGQSYRLSYSKLINATDTDLSLAAYRFSSENFLTFGDFAHAHEDEMSSTYRERNRIQASINQFMGHSGHLNISSITRDFWGEQSSLTTFQVNYGNSFGRVSINLSASRDIEKSGENDTFMLTATLPIGSGDRSSLLSITSTADRHHQNSTRLNVSGSFDQKQRLSYGLYTSRDNVVDDHRFSYGGNLSYRSPFAMLGIGYSKNEDSQQFSTSVNGTVVAHDEGVVFSSEYGETMALAVAEGASGSSLGNGVRLDSDGEALTSNLVPYRRNSVSINPDGIPNDVELKMTARTVIPRRGAVVRVRYPTVTGTPLLLHVHGAPFGAQVVNDAGQSLSIIGQGGLTYLRGAPSQLRVIWGQHQAHSCRLQFTPPGTDNDSLKHPVEAQCLPN